MRCALLLSIFAACGGSAGPVPSTDATDVTDSGGPWWAAAPGDLDGDGVLTADGDCDDGQASVRPGRVDQCNGQDDDCDGRVDEDSGEALVFGFVHPADDVDRYAFYVEDASFGVFSIEAWLYGVPQDADYQLALSWLDDPSGVPTVVASADARGAGGEEDVSWGGEFFVDDSGWYEVAVWSWAGEGCASPYALQILVGGE
jgi:hypothetical protein